MLTISKTLAENFIQIAGIYLSQKDKNQFEGMSEVCGAGSCDFYEISGFLREKLNQYTFIDVMLNFGQAALKSGSNAVAEFIFESIAAECGDDEKLIDYAANANLELGKILASRFLWKESLVRITAANELYTKEKNFKSSYVCETLLALIFEEIGGYPNARKHFANCLLLVNDKNDSDKLGFIFSNLGILEFYQNNMEGAISNFRRAEIYYQKVNNQIKILELKYNLSLLYLLIKDYNNAFREIEETIFNNETKSYFSANDKIYINKVKTFIERNDFTFAIPLNHHSFDVYGFRTSNDIIEYIYQLKTAISNNVNSVYKTYAGSMSVSQKNRSSITII